MGSLFDSCGESDSKALGCTGTFQLPPLAGFAISIRYETYIPSPFKSLKIAEFFCDSVVPQAGLVLL